MRKASIQFARFGRMVSVALILGLLALLPALLLQATPVLAHGGAELTVTPVTVAPGGTVQVKAEGVEAGEEFTITLEGIKGQAVLGTITVVSATLQADYTIPADTQPGTYQVTAVSGGGETLTVELTVEAAAGAAAATPPAKPSAASMQLDRSKSVGEWVVIVVGLLASAGLGLALVVVKK